MKRFMLSLTLVAMGAVAFMPMAQAAKGSATQDSAMSDQKATASSLHQRVQHNRDLRNSK